MNGFNPKAIATWASASRTPGSTVLCDGLACFSAHTEPGFANQPTVEARRKPKDLPEFEWINTMLVSPKTTFSGVNHAFDLQTYAHLYLATFNHRFNRRFNLRTLHDRLLVAAARCSPHPDHMIRMAEGGS